MIKILLIGSIGKRNIGDDAICISLIKTLINIYKSRIFLYVHSKGGYFEQNFAREEKLQVHFVYSFIETLKAFMNSRFLIIGGGDYIGDYEYFMEKKFFLKTAKVFGTFFALAILARIFSKKFLMINNGFCITTRIGLACLKIIIRLTNSVSVRDSRSFSLLSKDITRPVVKGFDTALLLDENYQSTIRTYEKSVIKIGFSITPVFSNLFLKPEKDEEISDAIARVLNMVLKRNNNVYLDFLAFSTNPNSGDLNIIRNIIQKLDRELLGRIHLVAYNHSLSLFLSKFSELDYVVCCKYHSIIFSYLFEKPMIVIGYHPKNFALIHDIKLSRKAFLSLDEVLKGKIQEILLELLSNPQQFKASFPLYKAKRRALNGVLKCIYKST